MEIQDCIGIVKIVIGLGCGRPVLRDGKSDGGGLKQDCDGDIQNRFGLLLIPHRDGLLLQFACNLCSSYAILSIKSQSFVLLQSHRISI